MTIDWTIFSYIAPPVIAVFLTAFVSRYFSERESLIAFYGHIASHAFNSVVEGKEVAHIHTHAVVIRNNGNKTAKNIRISHNYLPDFKIYPETEYEVKSLPNGGKELVIPRITPKKEYTISYLYFPPITYNDINSSIESDVGTAKIINVKLQQIFPRWVNFLSSFFICLGLITSMYIVYEVVRRLVS